MPASEYTDEELISNIEFCKAVMDTDSEVDDVWIEYEDNDKITLAEMLAEAARRAEKA